MDNLISLFFTLFHITIWVLVYLNRRKRLDVFDPFYQISALYALIFVYGPFVWLQRGQTSYQGIEVMAYLGPATLVFNIGYFCFAVGSLRGKRLLGVRMLKASYHDRPVAESVELTSEEQRFIVRYAGLVYVISMSLSILYYLLIGRSILSLFTLGQMGETAEFNDATGLYFLKCFMRSAIPAGILLMVFEKHKSIAFVCALLLCVLCISSGSRNLAITMILSFFVVRYTTERKRPRLMTLIILVCSFYLLIGFIGTFRQSIKMSYGYDISSLSWESMSDAMMYNIEIFYPFYTLVQMIPSRVSFHYGLGFINIIIQFIPRTLWHGKPAMLGLTAFQAMYGDSMGGAAYPNIGEFYYEFGIFGVIAFMYLYGKIMQKLYHKSFLSNDKLAHIIYGINYGYIIQFVCRGHIASWAIDYVFMLCPIVILRWMLIKKRAHV